MFSRSSFRVAMALSLVLPIFGCSNTQVSTVQVSPSSSSLAVGQTVQLTATGIVAHGSHPTTSSNVTAEATWSSSTPAVATVSAAGLVTAVAAGSTTITAALSGSVSSTATITVTSSGGGATGGSLTSLAIIPGTQSVAAPSQTTQFIAIGTTSTGATEDVTNNVTWGSSSSAVGTINATGLATGVGAGTTTITAIATNSDSSVVTATSTFTVTGGTSEQLTALTITPGSESLSASGQTGQLIALGTAGSTGLEEDETTNTAHLKWSSSVPSIATVSATGLVTGVSAGSATIEALWTNSDGSVVSASANVAITATAAPEPLLSLTIIPSAITVGNLQDTGNFLAVGTFSTVPFVRDLTNSVKWISSAPDVFPVDSSNGTNTGTTGGIVTAYGDGSAVIIAEATSSDGTIQTATANFNCPLVLPNPNGNPPTAGSCYPGSQAPSLKATITVYNEGLNTTGWLVTAPSATGTADVIHCGPGWALNGGTGGSVCAAAYPIPSSKIILTAPAETGVSFGGWSTNCTISDAAGNPIATGPTAAGPNYCVVSISDSSPNITVGAIFN